MAITNYETFLDALGDVVITNVSTRLNAPPRSVETADLPLSYPSAVLGEVLREDFMTVKTPGGWPQMTANLIVVLEPAEQNTYPANHALTVGLVDDAATAFRGLSHGTLGKRLVGWSIELTNSLIIGGDSTRRYWALIIAVEAEG